MAINSNVVGNFTAENIVAVLRALPETDGTYSQVIERTKAYDGNVPPHALGKWVTSGRRDLKADKHQTAFARFAQRYDQIMEKHCNADANRNRELDRAFEILERACDCGNEKAVTPDGKLADQCRECQDIDGTGRRRNRTT